MQGQQAPETVENGTAGTHGHTRLTRRQAAILGAFTGISCGPFGDVQLLGDELLGRPTWTHEYGNRGFVDDLKERVRPLFMEIVAIESDEASS